MLSWLTSRRTAANPVAAAIRRLNEPPPIGLTVDVAVFANDYPGWRVLMIERRDEPYRGALALPGGYVEYGENLAEAAARELREETGLTIAPDELHQVGAYGDPTRDPRGHVVSIAYQVVVPPDEINQAVAGDDAATVSWPLVEPLLVVDGHPRLAFDHTKILTDAYYSC